MPHEARTEAAVLELNLRPARLGDIPHLLAIQSSAPEAAQWNRQAFEDVFKEPEGNRLLVAESGGELIGFILARMVADEAEVLNLAIQAAFRRRGVGQKLMLAALRNVCGTVFLEVRESNHVAREFYRRLGFEESGVRPGYYSNPSEGARILRRRNPLDKPPAPAPGGRYDV